MPAVLRSTSSSWARSGTDAPDGVTAGDFLLCVGFGDEVATNTPPAGWTRIAQRTTFPFVNIYTKTATASEPDTYVWTGLGRTESWLTVIFCYQVGTFHPTTPVTAVTFGGTTTPSGNTQAALSVTAGIADSTLITAWYSEGSNPAPTYGTVPSGMTQVARLTDGWAPGLYAREQRAATGATGTRTVTLSASREHSTVSLLVQPSATVATPGTQKLRIGGTVPSALRVGSTPVTRAYLGNTLVWGS